MDIKNVRLLFCGKLINPNANTMKRNGGSNPPHYYPFYKNKRTADYLGNAFVVMISPLRITENFSVRFKF